MVPRIAPTLGRLEAVMVTAVNPTGCTPPCVQVNQGIEHPNWSVVGNPIAIITHPVQNLGLEDVIVDSSGNTAAAAAVYFWMAWGVWARGVEVINSSARAVTAFESFHGTFADNYVFGNPTMYNDHTAFHPYWGGDNLIQNNICHQVKFCVLKDGPEWGDVVAYNYSPSQYNDADYMTPAVQSHSAGDDSKSHGGQRAQHAR